MLTLSQRDGGASQATIDRMLKQLTEDGCLRREKRGRLVIFSMAD